jgi:hypothetical protein
MYRRLALIFALCSTLALFAAAPGSRAAEPAPVQPPVLAPAIDGGTPSPPPLPLQVIVCPANCIECGSPGVICCLPGRQCIVLWMPVWFRAPGDALDGAGVLAPLRACSASSPTTDGGP